MLSDELEVLLFCTLVHSCSFTAILTSYQNPKEYTSFSAAHGVFSKIVYLLGDKACLKYIYMPNYSPKLYSTYLQDNKTRFQQQ